MDFRTVTTAMALLFALGLAAPAAHAQNTDPAVADDVPSADSDITTRDRNERREERGEPLVPDVDESGYVSREESAADWERSFSDYDADQNQQLSDDEWLFGDDAPAFGDVDTDTDQMISQDEWMSYGEQDYEEALTEVDGEEITTRDYNERRAWRDEGTTPSVVEEGEQGTQQ